MVFNGVLKVALAVSPSFPSSVMCVWWRFPLPFGDFAATLSLSSGSHVGYRHRGCALFRLDPDRSASPPFRPVSAPMVVAGLNWSRRLWLP
ncbi:hypothetical protein CRG98_003107 [Punica granatum]|uniref:Uncharacterized protein n=1 Tax=Punica granatum TaxID=22663 RepID=A0A2I0L8U6_PUNGR|nr:hypothetical protein CRG98_003107 [Punica granatum]